MEKKNINAQVNFRIKKMIPQTIHMLVYKNAIANGLRTTEKLPLENVKQFDEMIKQNRSLINNNFSFLDKK